MLTRNLGELLIKLMIFIYVNLMYKALNGQGNSFESFISKTRYQNLNIFDLIFMTVLVYELLIVASLNIVKDIIFVCDKT